MLRSLKELLASDDLDAETFDDPGKFLDYARDRVIRLAVLDLWMPTHSGLEIQEQLHHLSSETKVIITTGRGESGTRALALDGGAFAFLAKPLDVEAFLAAVRGALVE